MTEYFYLQAFRHDDSEPIAFRGFLVTAGSESQAYLFGQREATARYKDDKSVLNDWVVERW